MILNYLRKFLLIVFVFAAQAVCAQPGPPPPDPGDPVPITGIEILIGAGALLGAKRMINTRKKGN